MEFDSFSSFSLLKIFKWRIAIDDSAIMMKKKLVLNKRSFARGLWCAVKKGTRIAWKKINCVTPYGWPSDGINSFSDVRQRSTLA